MALVPCTADTDTLDFDQDVSGNLIGNVRLDPAGGLTSTGAGIKANLAAAGGLGLSGNTLQIKAQSGGGLVMDSNGVIARQLFTYTGWRPGLGDNQTHSQSIPRGAQLQVGPTLSLNMSLAPSIGNVVNVGFTWTVNMNTNLTGFAPSGSSVFDTVTASLQGNFDNGGWFNVDEAALYTRDQAGLYSLSGTVAVGLANSTVHNMQARLVATGGVLSGTAIQGAITSSQQRGIYVYYMS